MRTMAETTTKDKVVAVDPAELKAGIEKAFYATVGAGVVAGRKLAAVDLQGKLEELRTRTQGVDYKAKADEVGTKARDQFMSAYGEWAEVGSGVVGDLREKVDVDDLTNKVGERVHVDQWQEQAGKLRGQLEDLVTNWRANFAPEGTVSETIEVAVEETTEDVKKVAKTAKAAVKQATADDLTELSGVGPTYATRLAEAGITTFAALAKADAAKVAEIAQVSEKAAGGWVAGASAKARA